jgi:hypothetical protein
MLSNEYKDKEDPCNPNFQTRVDLIQFSINKTIVRNNTIFESQK